MIGHRFAATTDEMMATLVKTSYSPNIKERRDCSVAVFDAAGELVALTAIAPIHLSSLLGMVRNITERHPLASLRPGDAFLTNDPYVGGGSHLPDLTLMNPVFVDGRVVAFVANLAHHSYIGGKVAGRRPRARRSKLDAHKVTVDRLLREGVWNAVVILRAIQAGRSRWRQAASAGAPCA